MAEDLVFQQTLHGYKDGHQLLVSSLDLNQEQDSELLFMSDLSGSPPQEGFNSYLTGYPLSSGGFYCFARSWYATELPRPGCVWTHTILIEDQDLARISALSGVIPHFRRPQPDVEGRLAKSELVSYSEQIRMAREQGQPSNVSADLAIVLIKYLYGSDLHIVVESESSETYQDTVLAFFDQQWPRLRRNFCFSTGALSLRDNVFDVAIAPSAVSRLPSKETAVVHPADIARASAIVASDDWIRVAAQDLLSADQRSALRQFLWRFGPDYQDGRGTFRSLCEIFLATDRDIAAGRVGSALSAVGHFFPEPTSSKRLKAEFFGRRSQYTGKESGEVEVLEVLVAHPASECIPDDVAEVSARARSLATLNFNEATRIALTAKQVGGMNAERYLAGYAAGAEEKADALDSLPISLLLDLLIRQSSLVSLTELWRRPAEEQVSLALKLGHLNPRSETIQSSIRAIIAAGAWQALRVVFDRLGYNAIQAALGWMDEQVDGVISTAPELSALLWEHTPDMEKIAGACILGIRASKLVSSMLDPRSSTVRRFGTAPWIEVAQSGLRFSQSVDELRSRVFLLAVGLSSKDLGDVVLTRAGFSDVYEAARQNRLENGIWELVDPYLPWSLITWDRCARLIRGVLGAFLERSWPPSEFLKTFATEEQFTRAVEEASWSREGNRYIKRLYAKIQDRELPSELYHERALNRLL